MVLFILSILGLVVGIVWLIDDNFWVYHTAWAILITVVTVVCGLMVLSSVIYLLQKPIEADLFNIEYSQNAVYLERCYNSDTLSAAEVTRAVTIITDTNNKILKASRLSRNVFFGWLVNERIGSFPIFSMSRLPGVRVDVTTDLDVTMELEYGY